MRSHENSEKPVRSNPNGLTLKDARLHLRPYSNPLFDQAVAAVASPSGARLAGRFGAGLLSLGAAVAVVMDVLAHHRPIQVSLSENSIRTLWNPDSLLYVANTQRRNREREIEMSVDAVWCTTALVRNNSSGQNGTVTDVVCGCRPQCRTLNSL